MENLSPFVVLRIELRANAAKPATTTEPLVSQGR
jgi:hypothetical protein